MANPFTAFAFSPSTSGANVTPRTMPDVLNDIADVLDYGADPTGATDSWAAINDAITRFEFTVTATGTSTNSGGITTIPIGGGVPAFILANAARFKYAGLDVTDPTQMPGEALIPAGSTSTSLEFQQIIGTVVAGHQIKLYVESIGTIYFPPGNYMVSQTIDWFYDANQNTLMFQGAGNGASTIFGSFPDYIFRRTHDGDTGDNAGQAGGHGLENLNIINFDPNGGGIRIGFTTGGWVRNCTVTANRAINTSSDDAAMGVISQEITLENCRCYPGVHTTNSVGIATVADGPIINCVVSGFQYGMICWGGQGDISFRGCRFELCETGLYIGLNAGLTPVSTSDLSVYGCHFKDCQTGINFNGSGRLAGIVIEFTGATVFGAVPQYGIIDICSLSERHGILVTGPFAVAGIALTGSNAIKSINSFAAITVNNTAGGGAVNWQLPVIGGSIVGQAMQAYDFTGCNVVPVYHAKDLPVTQFVITATSWADGSAVFTLSVSASVNINRVFNITVVGAPTGYNGFFKACLSQGNDQLIANIPSSPAGSGASGTVLFNIIPVSPVTDVVITRASWSSGVATISLIGLSGLDLAETNANLIVENMALSGYNGPHMGATIISFPVTSYTYNSTTGVVVLTMTNPVTFDADIFIGLAGLNIAGLNGFQYLTTAVSSSTSVTFTALTGLSGVASGGGTVTQANQLSFPLAANPGGNYAAATFQGSISGTALTVVSGLVGTIAIGDTLSWAFAPVQGTFFTDTIVGGSNPNWVLNTNWGSGFPTQGMTASLGDVEKIIGPIRADQLGNAIEGDCYNIDNSNTATWGALPDLTASGSTHAKLRYNGTAFTVVGI